MPEAITKSTLKQYRGSDAVTDLAEFADRDHYFGDARGHSRTNYARMYRFGITPGSYAAAGRLGQAGRQPPSLAEVAAAAGCPGPPCTGTSPPASGCAFAGGLNGGTRHAYFVSAEGLSVRPSAGSVPRLLLLLLPQLTVVS